MENNVVVVSPLNTVMSCRGVEPVLSSLSGILNALKIVSIDKNLTEFSYCVRTSESTLACFNLHSSKPWLWSGELLMLTK